MKSKTFLTGISAIWIAFHVTPMLADTAPAERPFLRIESGMHVGPIVRIDVDKSCRLMVTGSKDKTARLWALPPSRAGQPKLLHTLRVPIGDGDEGKIFAVALSPDGSLAAAGGWDVFPEMNAGHAIYIFDARTGKMLRRIGDLGSNIRQIAFSASGKYLAATISSNIGLKIWDTASWALIAEDRDYGGDAYGAAFGAAGELFTVSFDGFIRKYGQGFRLEAKVKAQGNGRPFTVAVHPAGEFLAIGYDMSPIAEVYSAKDLSRLYVPSMKGYETGDLSSVAWSADGKKLYGAGKYGTGEKRPVRIWADGGKGVAKDAVIARNNIDELLTCGSHIAFGGDEPAFGLIDANGKVTAERHSVSVDAYQKVGNNFTISRDGTKIRFGLGMGDQRPVLFDVSTAHISDSPKLPAGLFSPDTESLAITNWHDALGPKLEGKALAISDSEYSHSLAIGPGDTGFVLGAEWHLRAFSKSGQPKWVVSSPAGVAWGMNISGDGRFAVAAYGDGTFRWYRLDNGQEVLSLFVQAQNREWVMWTPEGYYNSSPNGDRYVGWHLNKGWSQEAEFVSAAQLKDHYFRPDVVKRVVALADSKRAIAELAPGGFRSADLTKHSVPKFKIVAPAEETGVVIGAEYVSVTIAIEANADPITSFEVSVNGRQVTTIGDRNLVQTRSDGFAKTFAVPLQKGENIIQISATNAVGSSEQKVLTIGNTKLGLLDKRGTLYLLAVGVDDYQFFNKLSFAGADAKSFADSVVKHIAPLHKKVEKKILAKAGDAEPTRANIEDALDMFRRAGDEDTSILFLAGHGTNEGQDYLFIPQDAAMDQDHLRPSTVLKWSAFQSALQNARGRRIMFVDTCHAGGAYNFRLVKDATDAQIVVFSATDSETLALELSGLQHGVFSYSIIKGLNGDADLFHRGAIYVLDLGSYISHEVEKITSNAQEPTFNLASSKNFVVANY
jgi:WD40 repeat protein